MNCWMERWIQFLRLYTSIQYPPSNFNGILVGHLKTLGTQTGYPIGDFFVWSSKLMTRHFSVDFVKSEILTWFTKLIPVRRFL